MAECERCHHLLGKSHDGDGCSSCDCPYNSEGILIDQMKKKRLDKTDELRDTPFILDLIFYVVVGLIVVIGVMYAFIAGDTGLTEQQTYTFIIMSIVFNLTAIGVLEYRNSRQLKMLRSILSKHAKMLDDLKGKK